MNSQRFDPYKNFKFRVRLDGRVVAGFGRVGALKRTKGLVEHHEIGDPSTSRQSPGRTKFDAITLERGVTHDPEFVNWASTAWSSESRLDAETPAEGIRKNIVIEILNEEGQLALAYELFRCWVSDFQAAPDLDTGANAVAIETIKLENEGWERDLDVTGR